MNAQETPLDLTFPATEIDQGNEDFRVTSDVQVAGKLFKKGERYRLAGQVRARLEVPCSRCLERFSLPVEPDVDLTYQPRPEQTTDADVELEEEDLTTAFYRDHVIDLAEMIREQFYLALPMRPLCREDCRGLCPHCGTNLNAAACGCDVRWEDPRLAGLRSILDHRRD
jgi:uncharacterized protein